MKRHDEAFLRWYGGIFLPTPHTIIILDTYHTRSYIDEAILITMKLFLSLFTLVSVASNVQAFQFMKNWKMPVHDPHEQAVKERFGDKSKWALVRRLVHMIVALSLLKRPFLSVLNHSSLTELVVITGPSSGLGRKTAQALLLTGEYHVIGAVRDLDKMEAVAEIDGFDMESFTPIHCDLNSFDSVREFCEKVEDLRLSKPIDRLICNAGIYQPTLPYAKWSKDNHEQTMQTNYLSHFLMISILMKSLMDSTDPRVIMVGSVTGNDNTVR